MGRVADISGPDTAIVMLLNTLFTDFTTQADILLTNDDNGNIGLAFRVSSAGNRSDLGIGPDGSVVLGYIGSDLMQ